MHQALYRKWRPKSFDDVVGQEHITATLRNEIAAGKPAHAYLLMGSHGTGKTTCAKLIAKAVNCLAPHEGSPCGVCEVCLGVDDGSMVDVVEIDAASNNGVDNIRDLRDEAHFLPNVTKYRVYIIDEAHMLSIGAVNALLKILEEPPAHVIFILATTEIHKMPATIQSRCQRFDFNRIESGVIAGRLQYICEQENISFEDEALGMIARLSDGGMRDAISMLDLCSSAEGGITVEAVSRAAGLIGQDYLFEMAAATMKHDIGGALKALGDAGGAVAYDQLCQQLIGHFRNLMIAASVPNPERLIICLPETLERYKEQAGESNLTQILQTLNLLQRTAAAMARTANRRTELELCLAKLCEPQQDSNSEALIARVEELEAKLNAIQAGVVSAPVRQTQPPSPRPAAKAAVQAAESVPPPVSEPEQVAPPRSAPLSKPPVTTAEPESTETVQMENWEQVLKRLGEHNPALRGALLESKAYISGSRVLIDSANPIFRDMMRSNEYTRTSLKQAIAEVTGKKYSIGPYERRETAKQQTPAVNPLDEVLKRAADGGIEIKQI